MNIKEKKRGDEETELWKKWNEWKKKEKKGEGKSAAIKKNGLFSKSA